MDKKEGLLNYCLNIRPIMLKILEGKEIHNDELKSIMEFYREVMSYLAE